MQDSLLTENLKTWPMTGKNGENICCKKKICLKPISGIVKKKINLTQTMSLVYIST